MSQINKKFPLILEEHPDDYNGYPFITLIVYGNDDYLTIVDNYNNNQINAYVLDLCSVEHVDEETLIEYAKIWYYENKQTIPISILFSKEDVLSEMKKIHKNFNINYVKRIIGPLPKFDMDSVKKVKRKKRKVFDINIPVINKLST